MEQKNLGLRLFYSEHSDYTYYGILNVISRNSTMITSDFSVVIKQDENIVYVSSKTTERPEFSSNFIENKAQVKDFRYFIYLVFKVDIISAYV